MEQRTVDPQAEYKRTPLHKREPRTGFGRFLQRAAPAVGRVAKSIALGAADGVPFVSQVISTVTAPRKVNNVSQPIRLMSGWATVCLVGMAMVMKLWGHVDAATLVTILRILVMP